jgi:hypothetical protein
MVLCNRLIPDSYFILHVSPECVVLGAFCCRSGYTRSTACSIQYAILVSSVFPHCLQVPIIIPFLGIICIDFNSLSMKTYYCNCERYCQGD